MTVPPQGVEMVDERSSPTVRRRRLGYELRKLREDADLKGAEVAKSLGWSTSKISRIETGRISVTPEDVGRLLDLYGIAKSEQQPLAAIAQDSAERGWWQKYSDILPDWFEFYIGLEAEADGLDIYESELVPGLLQTEEYARHLMSTAVIPDTPDEIERSVQLRLTRQRRLHQSHPLHLRAVLSEGALRREVGGRDVLLRQIQHILNVATIPTTQVQVLPFTAGDVGAMGPFGILLFPPESGGRIVYLESLTSSLYLEKFREVGRYRLVFERLQQAALSPEETLTFMADLVKEVGG